MKIFPVKVTGALYIVYGLMTVFIYLETSSIPIGELLKDLEVLFLLFLPIPAILALLGIGILKGEKHLTIASLFLLPACWIWLTVIIALSGLGGSTFPVSLWIVHLLVPLASFVLTIWTLMFLRRGN